MSSDVSEIKEYESRPTSSPVRLRADPHLVADVSVCSSAGRQMDEGSVSFNGSTVSLSDMPDVPSDDENGEVFDKMVASMLIGMNMQQYVPLFKDADVGLNMFLYLTEEDLEVIGVTDKKDRTDIAHGIANIRRKKKDEVGPKSISGDVEDTVISTQEALTIMCYSVKHINNLVILLRNYRSRMDSRQMRNSLIDPQHCAGLGVKILTKEALLQADLLKVQLNGLLAKLEPGLSQKSPNKNKQTKNRKINSTTVMQSVLVLCSISLFVTSVALAMQRR